MVEVTLTFVPTPVSSLPLLWRAQISPPPGIGVKSLIHSPWLPRPDLRPPVKISTTNPRARLLVVTHTAVDRGEWQDTLKPSSADASRLTRLRHLMLYHSWNATPSYPGAEATQEIRRQGLTVRSAQETSGGSPDDRGGDGKLVAGDSRWSHRPVRVPAGDPGD